MKDFVDRVARAKAARVKSGDVGAAFLIAPAFDVATVSSYRSATVAETVGRWTFQEALTHYEGFVRLGPRRGFHLLLVSESPDGFEPILPS